MIFNVVRKHLQPHVHRSAINTRYSFCSSNIFQDVGKLNQTQFPNIWENLILQDFNVSELKRLPTIILLQIHNSSVIILPKYINNMDSRDSTLKDPDNSQTDPRCNPGIEDMNRNDDKKARALSPDGQKDPLERPSKKMKVMDATEAATTPEETKDRRKITDTVSEIDTYTSLDNGVKQDNISPNATQLNHNKDHFYVDNEVSGNMTTEQNLPAALNISDSDTQNKENPSQTETTDIEMRPPDTYLDHQPAKSVITSENVLQEIVVSATPDIKPIIDKLPKEENHPSPAKRRGYRGLRNQGATCYLNAVLQTLFMTEDFRKVIMDLHEDSKKKMKGLFFELQKLFKNLESYNKSASGSVTTYGVTKALEIRNVCEQQDAAEYYQKILSMIEPKAAKIFQGQKKHLTTCIHGNHDPAEELISFFSLAISMDSDQHTINIMKSFNAQFEVMHMDGEDQLYCETCNKMVDMEMRCIISELPDVLTLHLQRFYLDYNYMIYKKNNRRVEIPLQLEVQDHHLYELFAIVNHTGSLSGGHYYADIKSFEDQQWYEFNDSSVQRIPDTYDVRHITSDMAFLLFFRKSHVMRSDKSEGPQNNRTSNSEDSVILPHQHPDHISTNIENNHDFTANDEQDLSALMNTSDSDTESKANSSQTVTLEIEMKSPDASSSAAEANNKSMSENLLQEIVVSVTKPIKEKQPEEDNHLSLTKKQ
ncbi:hypothetical protein QQF64_018728, partial [Cirrhinus molitorella]